MSDKVTVTLDTREVDALFKKVRFDTGDMLEVEKPMALTIVNTQRILVPVDTGATRASIMPDIQSATAKEVIDHIGPSTEYAPFIELGVKSKPNYPMQPFVRPSVFGAKAKLIIKVGSTAFKNLIKRKYGRS